MRTCTDAQTDKRVNDRMLSDTQKIKIATIFIYSHPTVNSTGNR